MKDMGIWSRNRIYFYLSFFSAGTQGIITQFFVGRYYPDCKELVLPVILIAGASAYISGIYISGRNLDISVNIIKIMLALNLAGFLAILTVKSIFPFIIAYCTACFSCNFTYNYLDHYFVGSHGQKKLETHVKSMLVYQMLAFVLSPLLFAVSIGNTVLMLSILPPIALVFCLPAVLSISGKKVIDKKSMERIEAEKIPLSAAEKIFVAYVLLFLAVVTIAISMMAYILSEYYHFPDYTFKAGIVLMVMSFSAAAAIFILRPPKIADTRKDIEKVNFRPVLQTCIILLTVSMTVLLIKRFSPGFIYVVFICTVLGFAYGLFLNSTRKFAGVVTKQLGKRQMLTIFNNLQSIASFVGYSTAILLWFLTSQVKTHFYPLLMTGIIIILAAELLLIFIWVRISQRSKLEYNKNIEIRGG